MTASPWKFFSLEELSCRCGCAQMKMNADFMEKMVKLRLHYGFPLPVTSGYRCPEYDSRIGTSERPGAGPHTGGHALDLNVYGFRVPLLLKSALILGGFTGFGLKQIGDMKSRLCHIDDLTEQEAGVPRPNLWTYR